MAGSKILHSSNGRHPQDPILDRITCLLWLGDNFHGYALVSCHTCNTYHTYHDWTLPLQDSMAVLELQGYKAALSHWKSCFGYV